MLAESREQFIDRMVAEAQSKGADGIVTPMHPGAAKFWKEKGILK